MAARETALLFRVAERAVVALYDGGVLSPAVLQHVLCAFADARVKWDTAVDIRSVDGRTFHEIVVSTLMPAHTPTDAARDFARIIAQLTAGEATGAPSSDAGTAPTKRQTRRDREEPSDDDEALVEQLHAASRPKRRTGKAPERKRAAAPSAASAVSTGFNPLVNAQLPRKR
ncbi:hypothetical protein [Paraburkholderia caribensis]|uniref:hypothetical protein n=1 Tax=Paraburkholderia caribensis TaxID=75105 RepID=UPI00078E4156|nr:hypothetical protein [Paraburkholderia caribensis]AMV47360.1 hypothetical protein ATN79_42580 [Paraburkholderia caribensis]